MAAPSLRIAVIAHDAKKEAMADLLSEFLPRLREASLVATKGTGTLLRERLSLDIQLLKSGPEGGDLQVGGMAAESLLRAVVFLRDPLTAQPHEPDITALLRVCDVHNVPLATNPATDRIVLGAVLGR